MQSERIFQREDGYWFLRIRGNTSMGPYASHREADASLARYVASCERQADMAPQWPRWLHARYWVRRVTTGVVEATPSPKET